MSADEFFDSLPNDATLEEESLRDKLIELIEGSDDPSSTTKALKDAEVAAAWSAVRPNPCEAGLAEWIERRMPIFQVV